MTGAAAVPRPVVVALAAATIAVGFGTGFLVAFTRHPQPEVTTASATTTIAAPATAAVEPASSEVPAPSTTATEVPTTEPPTTTSTTAAPVVATTVPVAPTTARPVITQPVVITSPPTTALSPARLEVSYAHDALGRLVIPRSGSATFTIANRGGLSAQWLVTGTGFSTLGGGSAQGVLAGGASVSVTVLPPKTELPKGDVTGTIQVLGAPNGNIPFAIPA